MMRKNKKKGFTLVELVIVIAVIAILAAVLIPTFAVVIGNANKSAALQEGESLQTGILAEYNAGTFDDYCEAYVKAKESTTSNKVENIGLDTPIVIAGMLGEGSVDGTTKFKDYVTKIDGTITIEKVNDVWTISYIVGKYEVKITAKGVDVSETKA